MPNNAKQYLYITYYYIKCAFHNLKDKWYGALARRGFSLEIVKKVLDIKDINNADLILEGNVK